MAELDGAKAFTLVLEILVKAELEAEEERRRADRLENRKAEHALTIGQLAAELDKAGASIREWRDRAEYYERVGIELLVQARKTKMKTTDMVKAIEAAEKAFDEIPF